MKKILNKKCSAVIGIMIAFLSLSNLMSQTGWYPLQSGTSNVLHSVYFINSLTGFLAGNDVVLKSTNGGTSWQIISQNFGGTSVFFTDASTGLVCNGTLYRTTNGGTTWTNLNFSALNTVHFVNSQTGYAAGSNSQVLITANAGLNWFPQNIPLAYNIFNRVSFIDAQTGFVVGGRMYFPYYGIIYKTTNGGGNWRQIDPSAQDVEFTGVSFPNQNTGYIVGRYQYASSGVIYKTTDAGETWTQLGIYYKDLNDVCFPSINVGYAVGEDGTILKTVDGSSLWSAQQSNTMLDINSVYFLQDNLGFSAGNSGSAHKTMNGGVPGPPYAVSGKVLIQGMGNATSGIVKAVKYNRTTNSVVVIDSTNVDSDGNYNLVNIPKDTIYIFVFPNDEDNLLSPNYIPAYYGGVNTGTIHWLDAEKISVTGNLFNMNVQTFPIVSSGGSAVVSGGVYSAPPENGNGLKDAVVYAKIGNVFKGFGISRNAGVYDVNNIPQGTYTFICDRMGYYSRQRDTVVGLSNIINFNFYMTNTNPIGVTPIISEIPKQFNITQNYPNPFNPVTNINVSVPVKSSVLLVVFDMLGRQVETLINEELSPGNYKVNWDAANYSSGIYFYKLISNDFTDTKKMILIK
ncbi:MAG TPA: YCF48-related protein [Ignavibacteria bacterium]|nr:YCF48-related protein [Ignavibacteria bacterium]